MPDEQDPWLDREVAERLLRGEPPKNVDDHYRDRAERLAGLLDALTAQARGPVPQDAPRERPTGSGPPDASGEWALRVGFPDPDGPTRTGSGPAGAELPGEAAALAAYRTSRAFRGAGGARPEPEGAAPGPDITIGLPTTVRIVAGGPAHGRRPARWARPVRFAVAAVLAAGMVGGVAVATGTGVLSTPFEDQWQGPAGVAGGTPAVEPSSSAFRSPAPSGRDRSGGGSAGAASESPPRVSGSPRPGSPDRTAPRRPEGDDVTARTVADCRQHRAGELDAEGVRRLERAADGAARVARFCQRFLDLHRKGADAPDDGEATGSAAEPGSRDDDPDRGSDGDRDGTGDRGDDGPGNGKDHDGDRDHGDRDSGGADGKGGDDGRGEGRGGCRDANGRYGGAGGTGGAGGSGGKGKGSGNGEGNGDDCGAAPGPRRGGGGLPGGGRPPGGTARPAPVTGAEPTDSAATRPAPTETAPTPPTATPAAYTHP
ncbi:hypothetical protein ACFWIA_00060 [Streptomyces sp. NPDC127068]|uniref:hypothetical protein n=1 Tax=Streptomyces sp. NPDC127068 TaxID=3347127 RepID=UPI00365FA502